MKRIKVYHFGGKNICATSKRLFPFLMALLLVLTSLVGCGKQSEEALSNGTDGPTNTYTPPVNEDGYIVITIPVTLMGGSSAEEVIAEFQNSAQYDHEGETAPMECITDVVANEDGSVNYIFQPEQFESYKTQLYDTGRFQYGFGNFPSVQGAEYAEIDADGIPWAVVTFVDKADYEASLPFSSLYATVWPATLFRPVSNFLRRPPAMNGPSM